MTIYKPRNGTENNPSKAREKQSTSWKNADLALPLTDDSAGGKGDGNANLISIIITRKNPKQVERACTKVCAYVGIITLFIFAACLGYFVHQRVFSSKPVVEMIHIQFQDYNRLLDEDDDASQSRIDGGFYEQVEIDWKLNRYEKLNIPPLVDSKRSTVVHDFNYNLTAIVDQDQSRCFILPLNRTVTYAPRRFLECIHTVEAVLTLPNAKVERQAYRVVTTPVNNPLSLGKIIGSDCKYYHTYRLVKSDAQVALRKQSRSACEFSGDTYNLGETGFPIVVLITLDGCT